MSISSTLFFPNYLFPNRKRKLEVNKVYQGDCFDLMKQIEDHSVDLILCDLPYKFFKTDFVQWDNKLPLDQLWSEYKRIIKPNGAILLTAQGKFSIELAASNFKWYKYNWVWKKNNVTNFANAKKQPMRNHEDVLVFYDKQPVYNPQGVKSCNIFSEYTKKKIGDSYNKPSLRTDYYQTSTGYPKSIIEFNGEKKRLHPAQKPVSLFEFLIRTYSNEGNLILDNCAGVCTTAIAALNSNRNFICIEKEEKYCLLGEERIKQLK